MNAHLSEESEHFVRSQVLSGRYASEEEVLEEALRLLKQREQATSPPAKGITSEDEFERHLVEIGLMSRVPPPHDPNRPERDFEPVVIEGEPLSETIIRERR